MFHSLEYLFIRDEVHSLNTQDYSIAAGGKAVEFVFKLFGSCPPFTSVEKIDRQAVLHSFILSSMGVVLDRHSLYSFQNADQASLRRRFTSLSVEAIFDPR